MRISSVRVDEGLRVGEGLRVDEGYRRQLERASIDVRVE